MTTHQHPKTAAVASRKGGVTKTTTAVTTCAVLAEAGAGRTLLIDLDPQGHATRSSGLERPGAPQGAHLLITSKAAVPLPELVVASPYGFDVLTGGDDMNAADEHLGRDRTEGPYRLRDAIEAYGPAYDHIVIDCPGGFGDLMTAGLLAADVVLVPCPLDALSFDGLAKVDLLVQQMVRRALNPRLRIAAVLATVVDMRSSIARVMHAELVRNAGDLLLRGTIRDTSKFDAAAGARMPITSYMPKCDGAADYRAAVRELIERGVL
jgi:chromosome partitioning protein